ncbi:MAG: hypothetical protein Kow0063_16880 [Anaerolineae bacterium]
MNQYLEAALKLHSFIVDKHWNGYAVIGPDPIGKINWRVTRFVRSYTMWLPWKDNLAYFQAQSYWIRDNLLLAELTGQDRFLKYVTPCADFIVEKQLASGAWEHPPLRERRGFISTVESVWACLGLVAAYQRLGKMSHLDAALKGYNALINVIGLRQFKDGLAINYHAHTSDLVPNVTTMLLALVAEIHKTTGDRRYLEQTGALLRFLKYSQMENGELQYIYDWRPHFQCYQYNSFEFLDLAHYYQLTGDDQVLPILRKLASYLATGLTERGSCRYDCFRELPEVNYWTGALATALCTAHKLGLGNYLALSERASAYLLERQKPDGGFEFSRRNYGLLRDRRAYPRYLSMILSFLSRLAKEQFSAEEVESSLPSDSLSIPD